MEKIFMNNYLRLVLLACLFLLNSFAAPPPPYGTGMEIEDIVGALKTGNASQLSRYFDKGSILHFQIKATIIAGLRQKWLSEIFSATIMYAISRQNTKVKITVPNIV